MKPVPRYTVPGLIIFFILIFNISSCTGNDMDRIDDLSISLPEEIPPTYNQIDLESLALDP